MKDILKAYSDDHLKMSEIIFVFAQEVLALARTARSRENAILLAVVAWNIALQPEKYHEPLIVEFISTLHVQEGSEEWLAGIEIMESLILKKQTEYPWVFRSIHWFEFHEDGQDQQLKIVASISFSQSIH